MNALRVALLQLEPCATLSQNLTKGLSCCRTAEGMGADIALFPPPAKIPPFG